MNNYEKLCNLVGGFDPAGHSGAQRSHAQVLLLAR